MEEYLRQEQACGRDLSVTYLDDDVRGPLGRGQPGVYAKYLIFQRRVAQWVAENPHWDVAHHISWGSINHPVGLAGRFRPLVVGPAGGGQPLPPDLRRWVDPGPGTGWNALRNAVLRVGPLVNPWTRRLCRCSDVVFVTNPETIGLARRAGASDIRTMVPDGIRAQGEARTCPGPEVIWIGRVLPIKALGLAVASFRHVLREVPAARLTVVGDGPSLPAVKAAADDLVDAGQLRFTGRVPWHEGQRLLGQARVHLFTSLRDSFSAQALEAANAGTPTVAMRLGGLQVVEQGNGFHLVDSQPSQTVAIRLGAAVAQLLQADPAEWVSESRQAQAFARTCMYTERARLLLDLYASLAESAGRASTHG